MHPITNSLRALLIADHERLEDLAKGLLLTARAGDAPDLCPTWNEFEEALLAHLQAEENEIFPLFEADHKEETDALRREHAQLRSALDKAGLAVELHEVRDAAIEALLTTLRQHATHETDLLYRWTSKNLPTLVRQRLFARLRRRVFSAAPHSIAAQSTR